MFPFLALMTRDAKRQMIIMKIVCIAILVGALVRLLFDAHAGHVEGRKRVPD
ncbi:MAG: hypothetical protein WKG07_29405 [Hymenobacter sp.]